MKIYINMILFCRMKGDLLMEEFYYYKLIDFYRNPDKIRNH